MPAQKPDEDAGVAALPLQDGREPGVARERRSGEVDARKRAEARAHLPHQRLVGKRLERFRERRLENAAAGSEALVS